MNKLSLMLATFGLSVSALASYDQAPPSFSYNDAKAVFVDIQKTKVEITYDLKAKTAFVESEVDFYSPESGHPIIDLVPNPTEITLDGANSFTETIKDPDQQTTIRVVQDIAQKGYHKLKLKHVLTTNVIFDKMGVASGFWMSDLTDRRYLEQYLPANFEFDQYQLTLKVNLVGTEGISHLIKANGKITQLSENSYEIVFPAFYSASSFYFHLFPEKNMSANVQFYYKSIDGRMIPVDIYTNSSARPIEEFVADTKKIMAELENDYGAWPHEQLIIYGNSISGGMEHSGATATSLSALGHELFHSYHARALMPANGNAGWMDEAIARFRDNNYPLLQGLSFGSTKLAGHSVWTRMTDRMAYKEGSAFLSWVHYRMSLNGQSFKAFLRDYFQEYKYTTVTTGLFQEELTKASGLELEKDFDQYIYGKGANQSSKKFIHAHEEDPMHPKLSKEELLKLTTM